MSPPLLRVVVSPDCAGCRTAWARARAVRLARPSYPVEVLDVADRPLPAGVVGTPTYLLGEHVVCLGNPDLPDLLRLLDTAVGPDQDE